MILWLLHCKLDWWDHCELVKKRKLHIRSCIILVQNDCRWLGIKTDLLIWHTFCKSFVFIFAHWDSLDIFFLPSWKCLNNISYSGMFRITMNNMIFLNDLLGFFVPSFYSFFFLRCLISPFATSHLSFSCSVYFPSAESCALTQFSPGV